MKKKPKTNEMPILNLKEDDIRAQIYDFRGFQVLLDRDLAALYGVETKHLKRQVRRNLERFPADFMFELTKEEVEILRCQIGTSRMEDKEHGGTRYAPMVFTKEGVAMLSSVLKSARAIQVNIQIMRVFSRMSQYALENREILLQLERINQHVLDHDEKIKLVFDVLKKLVSEPNQPRKRVGFDLDKAG